MPTSIGKRSTANCCASTHVVVRPRAKFSATTRVTELSVCVTPSRTQPWSAQSTASARRPMWGCVVRSIMQSFVTCCSSTPRLSIGFPRLSQCCCAWERKYSLSSMFLFIDFSGRFLFCCLSWCHVFRKTRDFLCADIMVFTKTRSLLPPGNISSSLPYQKSPCCFLCHVRQRSRKWARAVGLLQ